MGLKGFRRFDIGVFKFTFGEIRFWNVVRFGVSVRRCRYSVVENREESRLVLFRRWSGYSIVGVVRYFKGMGIYFSKSFFFFGSFGDIFFSVYFVDFGFFRFIREGGVF